MHVTYGFGVYKSLKLPILLLRPTAAAATFGAAFDCMCGLVGAGSAHVPEGAARCRRVETNGELFSA
eukprot:2075607-Prymnesium_polylepis.1